MKNLFTRSLLPFWCILFALVTLYSCKKEPVANPVNNTNNTTAIAPETEENAEDVLKRGFGSSAYYTYGFFGWNFVTGKGPAQYFSSSSEYNYQSSGAYCNNNSNGNNNGYCNNNGNNNNGNNDDDEFETPQNVVLVVSEPQKITKGFDSTVTAGTYITDTLVTGGAFAGQGNGQKIVSGTVEIRKLSVRIYVAPISTANDPWQYFYDMVMPGLYPVASAASPNDGVFFSIRDNNGVVWTSLGNQTGSSNVAIYSRGYANSNSSYTNITGNAALIRMYDAQGNMKVFTNVGFRIPIGL